MPFRETRARFALANVLAIAFAAILLALSTGSVHAQVATKPKLLVVVVLDQFRESYLQEQSSYFGPGGFRRLLKEGAEFRQTFYPYSLTLTGPGHATIATGTYPRTHGVVSNAWVERASNKLVYCVEDPADGSRVSADHLLAPTLGSMVMAAGGKAVALSQKDRSALLLGGPSSSATVWMERSGRLGGRSAADGMPAWAEEWNGKKRRFKKWSKMKWEPLPVGSRGVTVVANDFPMREVPGFGKEFPHVLPAWDEAKAEEFWSVFVATPFSGDLLLDLVEEAVVEEDLGKDDKVDLLGISFSQTDIIGHMFGPDSAEVRDTVLRADQQMERLLGFLDKQVGVGAYTLVLTSDHGVMTVPEIANARGLESERVDFAVMGAAFDRSLADALRAEGLPVVGILTEDGKRVGLLDQNLTLDLRDVPEDVAARIRDTAARVLRGLPETRRAYSREEVLDGNNDRAPYLRRIRLSYHPGRGGDVAFVFRRGFMPAPTGTTHGSPDPADAIVPLVFFGAGVKAAAFRTISTPADVTPTLLAVSELPIPENLEGRVLPVSPDPAKHFKKAKEEELEAVEE